MLYVLDGGSHFDHATASVRFLAQNDRIPEMLDEVGKVREIFRLAIEERRWAKEHFSARPVSLYFAWAIRRASATFRTDPAS